MTTWTYVCKTCGVEVPADDLDLAAHSLTHGQVLVTDMPRPDQEDS